MSKKLYNQFKCSRMMLPEHREKLKEHHQQLYYNEKYQRPLFDQQQLEEFQHLFDQSIRLRSPVKMTILTEKGFLTIQGVIHKADPVSGQITIDTSAGAKKIFATEIIVLEKV